MGTISRSRSRSDWRGVLNRTELKFYWIDIASISDRVWRLLVPTRQRRELWNVKLSSNRPRDSRDDRFGSPLSATPTSSYQSFDSWCPSGRKASLDFPNCLEACARGIVKEAALHRSHSIAEATYMAEKIRQCSAKTRVEVAQLCIGFYTYDSFLPPCFKTRLCERKISSSWRHSGRSAIWSRIILVSLEITSVPSIEGWTWVLVRFKGIKKRLGNGKHGRHLPQLAKILE